MTTLDNLRKLTTVVADTGDLDSIKKHQPQDATTNPSLLFAVAKLPHYEPYIRKAMEGNENNVSAGLEQLSVNVAKEILSIIPGRVSVEVAARLSFDTPATIDSAHRILHLFAKEGIDKDRILIKIAATWEGIKAAEALEKEGIHCNLTLLFSFAQAVACAQAKVTLISPFVGRILDWHKQQRGVDHIPAQEDPGVLSVTQIYHYYKKFGYPTEIMGASFRNVGEIIELAGCDLLTISPALLSELQKSNLPLVPKLSVEAAQNVDIQKLSLDEKSFRWMLNEDAMATEKLSEGIRKFHADTLQLIELLKKKGFSANQ